MGLFGRKRKPHKAAFPLYHWSPVDRRASILRHGFKTRMKSRCGQWRPPYTCWSDSPSLAWALSGALSDRRGQWDLWMMWNRAAEQYEMLRTGDNETGRPTEFRVYHRIKKSAFWHVAVRHHTPGRRQGGWR